MTFVTFSRSIHCMQVAFRVSINFIMITWPTSVKKLLALGKNRKTQLIELELSGSKCQNKLLTMRHSRNNKQPSVGTKIRRKIISLLKLPVDIEQERSTYMAGGPPNCFICLKSPYMSMGKQPFTKLNADDSIQFCSHLGIPTEFFARKLCLFDICSTCFGHIKRFKYILTCSEAGTNLDTFQEELQQLKSFFAKELSRFYSPLDMNELKTNVRCVIGLCYFGPFLRRLIAEEMQIPKQESDYLSLEKITTHKLLTPSPALLLSPAPSCFLCFQRGTGCSRNSGLLQLNPQEIKSIAQLLEGTKILVNDLDNETVCPKCYEKIKTLPVLYLQIELASMRLAEAHNYFLSSFHNREPIETNNFQLDKNPDFCHSQVTEWGEAINEEDFNSSVKVIATPDDNGGNSHQDGPSFKWSPDITNESRVMDLPNLVHQCNVCSKTFAFADLLLLHEKFQHRRNEYGFLLGERQSNPIYSCEFCDLTFKTLQLLWKHRKSHTGDWPFVCSLCGKGFVEKIQWRQHVLLHQGIKEVECPVCRKLFSSRRIMRVHQRKHLRTRNNQCKMSLSNMSRSPLQGPAESDNNNVISKTETEQDEL